MTYQPQPIQESGGQKRTWTADDEARELLKAILVELRVMNLHLSTMSDSVFDSADVEVE